MSSQTIYLDYNATTPLDPRVIEVIHRSCHEDWANPSSSYSRSRLVQEKLLNARRSLLKMLSGPIEPVEDLITFTSSGTEANLLAIQSAIEFYREETNGTEKPHIVTTTIEHVAVELPLKRFQNEGKVDVDFVDVKDGKVLVMDIVKALKQNTCLVSVMLANNETGVIQPVAEIAKEIGRLNKGRTVPIMIHTDAAQAIGKIEVNIEDLNVDYLTVVGHKFYGPRIGALYHGPKTFVYPTFLGGGQERGRRSGTENVPMILGLARAADVVELERDDQKRLADLRTYFETKLTEKLGKDAFVINFKKQERLPNTTSITFKCQGRDILIRLHGQIDASVSAACHSLHPTSKVMDRNSEDGARTPIPPKASVVLVKSGLTPDEAERTIRFSLGKYTTEADIERAVKYISRAV